MCKKIRKLLRDNGKQRLFAYKQEKERNIDMCGIVGYTGDQQAAPILLAGLEKLEYRGYDSAGLAVRAIWYIVGYPISRMLAGYNGKRM